MDLWQCNSLGLSHVPFILARMTGAFTPQVRHWHKRCAFESPRDLHPIEEVAAEQLDHMLDAALLPRTTISR
jgi:hypothetical protein